MRKGWLIATSLALVLPLLGTIGCNASTPSESSFNLIFRYGVGAKNELNTFQGKYTRDMVIGPAVTVDLALSQEELDGIYQKMIAINFFDYPDEFSVSVPPGEFIKMVTPYESYYFKVEYNSSVKELRWEDEILNENEKANKLRELVKFIRDIIESKEEYKELPPPRGAYL